MRIPDWAYELPRGLVFSHGQHVIHMCTEHPTRGIVHLPWDRAVTEDPLYFPLGEDYSYKTPADTLVMDLSTWEGYGIALRWILHSWWTPPVDLRDEWSRLVKVHIEATFTEDDCMSLAKMVAMVHRGEFVMVPFDQMELYRLQAKATGVPLADHLSWLVETGVIQKPDWFVMVNSGPMH